MTLRTLIFSAIVCFAPVIARRGAARSSIGGRASRGGRTVGRSYPSPSRRARPANRVDRTCGSSIADIEARRGHLAACVDALEHAVAAAPGSADLYTSGCLRPTPPPEQVAPLCMRLRARSPCNRTIRRYLRAQATLATWVGEYRDGTGQLSSAPRPLSARPRDCTCLRACQCVGRGHR